MKKNTQFVLIVMFIITVMSCTSKHDKLTSEIRHLEETVRSQAIPDKQSGAELVNKYLEFADSFPEDSLAPTVLFNAARLSLAMNDTEQTMTILDRIIEQFNNSKPVADAYVLKGFIYETVYQDYASAREWYELFLKEFPSHHMCEDVRFSLNNLGKTPEELIAEFMQQQEEQGNQ